MKVRELVAEMQAFDQEMQVQVVAELLEDYELEDGEVMDLDEDETFTVRYGTLLIRAIQQEP